MLAPFNLQKWVKENTDKFTPPIGNHQLYKEQWENLLIMVIGGENYRPDYHDDPGEELFYQITGDLTLKIIDPHTKIRSEVLVREGELFLLPSHIRHSPQRAKGTVGLVVERFRQPGEVDALEWYDDDGLLEFRGEFKIENIETDLKKVQTEWQKWKEKEDKQTPTLWRVGEPI